MHYWRITKYNPLYRDDKGAYTKDEWTSYSDIGKTFQGKILTLEAYSKIEKNYIQAVLLFMKCLNLTSLRISCLEKDGRRPKKITTDSNVEIINNQDVDAEKIKHIIQLILRDKIWCKFKAKDLQVRFGHDFYMLIQSSQSCNFAIKEIEEMGLFAEEWESPYN